MESIRYDWSLEEIRKLYDTPLLALISKAHTTHATYHSFEEIQVCHLISIKTGGCQEDCKYCAQSSRYQTTVIPEPMMKSEDVLVRAQQAIKNGASRICLGAAWRELRDNKQFEEILSMIKGITRLGAEVCCTLGMLQEHQAKRLKEAGLYAYNHNLDSSEKFYKTIITTRSYQDRLDTLDIAEKNGLSVCCGGILGMGETVDDRLELLLVLSQRTPHPDSVPINQLSPIPGTPLQNQPKVSIWELVRLIALTRILMPKAMVRLSAGRLGMSNEEQALCLLAGANSIFAGEKLLTVPNPTYDQDEKLFQILGLKKRSPFKKAI